MAPNKIVLIGLDGLNPELVNKWQSELPTIHKLMEQGIYGKIKSTVPPNSPPAWSGVLSGKNPGHFGFWDFTYRNDYSYGEPEGVSSKVLNERTGTLYKVLSECGKKVAMVNVPVTYPSPEILGGYAVSSFMSPSLDNQFTFPASLKEEIKGIVGDYIIDISDPGTDFRQMDKEGALKRIYGMDRQRFELTKYFIKDKNSDFVFTVIMGTDRVSHLFYRYFDENHVKYTPDEKYETALRNHYRFCDRNIGEIINLLDDDTVLGILSAYSVQRLDGRVNLNEWLIQNGYLSARTRPGSLTSLSKAEINWAQTTAWATGCTGQIYLNVKGRETEGKVNPEDYSEVLDDLSKKITAIKDPKGNKLNTRTYKRDDVHFGDYVQYGPDLFVYFDNCYWGTNELVGHDSIYSYDSPQGPDDGNHGPYGFFVLAGPGVDQLGEVSEASLFDIPPTVLTLMSLDVPPDMEGRSLISGKEKAGLSEEEEKIKKRLRGLGYFEE